MMIYPIMIPFSTSSDVVYNYPPVVCVCVFVTLGLVLLGVLLCLIGSLSEYVSWMPYLDITDAGITCVLIGAILFILLIPILALTGTPVE